MLIYYTATVVVLTLAFLTPLFRYIPDATLAAIILMAVINITEFRVVFALWKTNSKRTLFQSYRSNRFV